MELPAPSAWWLYPPSIHARQPNTCFLSFPSSLPQTGSVLTPILTLESYLSVVPQVEVQLTPLPHLKLGPELT